MIPAAAEWLFKAHETRQAFDTLPASLAPGTLADAYAVQSAFVGMRAHRLGRVAGYKIALTTAAMRKMVGLDDCIAGQMLEKMILRGPAEVRARDYQRLIVEFEIAFEMGEDLPAVDAPYTRERVAKAVGAAMPAFELADDRNAEYKDLPKNLLTMVADNAWNEGAVLGRPRADWQQLDLAAAKGVATINGQVVGEGHGRDVMGHPLEALTWLANHMGARGLGLWRSDVIITGSLVTSKFPKAGEQIRFEVGGLGAVELKVS